MTWGELDKDDAELVSKVKVAVEGVEQIFGFPIPRMRVSPGQFDCKAKIRRRHASPLFIGFRLVITIKRTVDFHSPKAARIAFQLLPRGCEETDRRARDAPGCGADKEGFHVRLAFEMAL